MELLELKLRRVREAVSWGGGSNSNNGKLHQPTAGAAEPSNAASPIRHAGSHKPSVTWADNGNEALSVAANSNLALLSPMAGLWQRIQSCSSSSAASSPRPSPNPMRKRKSVVPGLQPQQALQELDNRPSTPTGVSRRVPQLFYGGHSSGPASGQGHLGPFNPPASSSSSPCLCRSTSVAGPVLDNRPALYCDTERNAVDPMPVSPNLAAKVLFSRPISVNFRNDDMETFFEESDFVTECIHWHNILRQRHQAAPLVLSSELCQSAQEWANHLAHNETFYHRNPRNVGENLFTRWSCIPEFEVTAREAVFYWYSGIKQYNFNAEPELLHVNAGQFTQLVWCNSTEVGIGKARARGGKITVVAHYKPQGNIIGHFQENVLPLVAADSDEVSVESSSGSNELPNPEVNSSSTAS